MGTSPLKLGLPKQLRLARQSDFLGIKTEGQRLAVGCLVLNWRTQQSTEFRTSPPGPCQEGAEESNLISPLSSRPSGELKATQVPAPIKSGASHPTSPRGGCRLGVVTSRRVGGAVTRNRVRRLVREAFRLIRQTLHRQDIDLVVVARPSSASADFQRVQRDLRRGLIQARLLTTDVADSSSLAANTKTSTHPDSTQSTQRNKS